MDLFNEVTDLMDEHVKEKCKNKYLGVYIFAHDGKPDVLDIDDDHYIWYLRFPGYTCGNIVFNKSDDTVDHIVLTRRGGAFAGGDETVFNDPDNLEQILTEKFKGKVLKDGLRTDK